MASDRASAVSLSLQSPVLSLRLFSFISTTSVVSVSRSAFLTWSRCYLCVSFASFSLSASSLICCLALFALCPVLNLERMALKIGTSSILTQSLVDYWKYVDLPWICLPVLLLLSKITPAWSFLTDSFSFAHSSPLFSSCQGERSTSRQTSQPTRV